MADLVEDQVCFCLSVLLMDLFFYRRNLMKQYVVQMDLVAVVDSHMLLLMAVPLNTSYVLIYIFFLCEMLMFKSFVIYINK
jgi:hypothetical protein